MAYQALYRKWRPQTFDDVRGQDAIVTTLKNQISAERIGHAYLFCGTRGTGKTSIAKIMARAVNCPHAAEHGGNPCNECSVCRSITDGSSMNVYEIDAASNNGVDNVREIREQVEYPPTEGRYKVYIIDEVHMLSTGAFNALLKTLEEPPAYVIFILATTDPQKIPQTILSRCQRYDFRRMRAEVIAGRIGELAEAEQLAIEPRAVRYIAKAADGSMRDALSLLDQCLAFHFGEELSYQDVLDILGAEDAAVFSELYRAICSRDVETAVRIVSRTVDAGREISAFLNDFIWYLRNVLLSDQNGAETEVLDVSEENLQRLREDAALKERSYLLTVLSSMSELANRLRFAAQKRILFEVELIRLCTAGLFAQTQTASYVGTPAAQNRPMQPAAQARAETFGAGAVQTPMSARIVIGEAQMLSGAAGAPRSAEPAKAEEVSAKIFVGGSSAEPARDEAAGLPGAENSAGRSGYTAAASETAETAAGNAGAGRDAESGANAEYTASGRTSGEAVSSAQGAAGSELPLEEMLRAVEAKWQRLIAELMPANRAVFQNVKLAAEQGRITVIFKSAINYRIAALNKEENGLIRLRALVQALLGFDVSFAARPAKPGEFRAAENRATDEELSRINFPIDIEP